MKFATSEDIRDAAELLADQLEAGTSIDMAVSRMRRMQPKHAQFWDEALTGVRGGNALSESLWDFWPDNLVLAVKAGESAGEYASVLHEISRTMTIGLEIRASLKKLMYPAYLMAGAVGASLFILFYVLPQIITAMQADISGNLLALFAMSGHNFIFGNLLQVAIGAGVVVGGAIYVMRGEPFKRWISDKAQNLPYIGEPVVNLQMGLWSHYVSIMTASGIPTMETLRLSASMLPERLSEAVNLVRTDMESKNIRQAIDPELLAPEDPRQAFPFYLTQGFMVAEQTGDVAAAMNRVKGKMVKFGLDKLNRTIATAEKLALFVAALMVGIPFLGFYSILIDMFNSVA